jgi:aldose sugar dehydrogenase
MIHRLVRTLAALVVVTMSAPAQPLLETRTVTDSLQIPWEILWGPDDHLWVTERPGRVSRIDPLTGKCSQIFELANPFGFTEVGMLGMALHPDFERMPFVYIVDAYVRDSTVFERVGRYRYDRVTDTLSSAGTLVDSIPAGVSHGGSRLVVGPDRMLYVSIGDKGDNPFDAVDHTKILGRTLRIALDGTVPADNPWHGYDWPMSLTWSFGHRNIQGLAFGPDGTLYASEHGPTFVDDEINVLVPGRNFGWPFVYAYCDDQPNPDERRYCADSNVVEPITVFAQSVAPAGIEYYDSPLIDELRGSLLLATLGLVAPDSGRPTHSLVQLRLSDDGDSIIEQRAWLSGAFGRIRDLCVSPEGRIFIATSNRDGRYWPAFEQYASDRIIEIRPRFDVAWTEALPIALESVCAGDTITIPFRAGGRFRDGNRFAVELSDRTGSFDHAVRLGATAPIAGSTDTLASTIVAALPEGFSDTAGYRLRVVATRPFAPSVPFANDLRIHARPTIVLRDSAGVLRADTGFVTYRWHVDDAVVGEGSEARWRAPVSGRYWVEALDSFGCAGASNVVEMEVSGVREPELAAGAVRIAPQPVNDRATIEIAVDRPGDVSVVVTNAAGETVEKLTRAATIGEMRIDLPFEELPPSIYLLEVRTPGGRWTGTIVKR